VFDYMGELEYEATEVVAPMVERWTPNPRVASSTLVGLIFWSRSQAASFPSPGLLLPRVEEHLQFFLLIAFVMRAGLFFSCA
jgi:hypothetical protein